MNTAFKKDVKIQQSSAKKNNVNASYNTSIAKTFWKSVNLTQK